MEFKISFNKNRPGSEHIQKSGISSTILSEVYDFLNFRTRDYGDAAKYINAYNRNALVFMVVNRVATNSATLPRKVVNSQGDEVTNSKIESVLNNPNTEQSKIEFLQNINEYLSLSGNAFVLNTPGIGAGNTLTVLESQNVTVLIDKLGLVNGYKYVDNMGVTHTYNVEEVLHIRLNSSLKTNSDQKYWGASPLGSLWSVITASDDLFTARSVLWKNKGVIGMITNKSDTPLLPKEREVIQNEFNKDTGGAGKANRMHVTPNDLGFIQTGMSPGDLKLLEGNLDNMRMIASTYKMPSVLFNDTENSTYNNVLESKRDAYTDAYIPLAVKVDEKISTWLSEILKVDEKLIVDITKIEVLKSTTNEVANRLNNLPTNVAARVMETLTIDEARNILGLQSVAGGNLALGKTNQNTGDENAPK